MTAAGPAVPAPDHAAIRSHVELLHTLAKSAGVDGIVAFTRIDANNKTHTERFAIGDVDHMTDAIIGWSTHPNLNIYASYAIIRRICRPEPQAEKRMSAPFWPWSATSIPISAKKLSVWTGFRCSRRISSRHLRTTSTRCICLGVHCRRQTQSP